MAYKFKYLYNYNLNFDSKIRNMQNRFADVANLDEAIETLLTCKPLPEDQVKDLCEKAKEIL